MLKNMTNSINPMSKEVFIADISDALSIGEDGLNLTDNPFEAGLDSLRLMILIEKWRSQGINIFFGELAERQSMQAWWSLIQERLNAAEYV